MAEGAAEWSDMAGGPVCSSGSLMALPWLPWLRERDLLERDWESASIIGRIELLAMLAARRKWVWLPVCALDGLDGVMGMSDLHVCMDAIGSVLML